MSLINRRRDRFRQGSIKLPDTITFSRH